jgi:hypothetical protein
MKNFAKAQPNLLVLVVLLLAAFNTFAQTPTAARPDRGITPNGAFSSSDIEHINIGNGNLNLTIPLASLPPIAGGKLSWTINAYYNSKMWDVSRAELTGYDRFSNLQYYTVDQPELKEGWRISGQYSIEFREAPLDYSYATPPVADPDYGLLVNYTWYKVVLVMPDEIFGYGPHNVAVQSEIQLSQ